MRENKPDLMAELAEVVRLLETKAMLSREGEGAAADFYLIQYEQASAAFIHKHHAELEAAVRDAALLDVVLRNAEKIIGVAGIKFTLIFEPMQVRNGSLREYLEATHNSAREG